MRFYDLDNAEELREELIEKLREFDKAMRNYQTDLYLYVDEETNTGEFWEFSNPGGNSWLNDDHYVMHVDQEHYESVFDWYACTGDVVEALGFADMNAFKEIMVQSGEYESTEEIEDWDIIDFIEDHEEYMEMLKEGYCNAIDECDSYEDQADEDIRDFDECQAEIEQMRKDREKEEQAYTEWFRKEYGYA